MNGLLAWVGWWSTAGCSCPRVQPEFSSLRAVVKMYQVHHGRPPLAEYGLRSLVERTPDHASDPRWMRLMDKMPLDPWGQPYRYIVSADLPDGYGFYSTGSDGVTQTLGNDPDDVNSWNPGKDGPRLADHGQAIFSIAFGSACLGLVAGWNLRRRPSQ